MIGWLVRLGIAGAIGLAAYLVWSKLNEDLEDDEFDEEIPIEFEVPLAEESTSSVASSDSDTGDGPGADLSKITTALGDAGEAITRRIGDAVEEISGDESGETEDNDRPTAETDVIEINGIGPVFQKRMVEAGISTIGDLAKTTSEQLQELGFTAAQADDWLSQAKYLAGDQEEEQEEEQEQEPEQEEAKDS